MPRESAPPEPALAAARLVSDHQAGVWRYLRALGCEASLADDLTQETFLAVLQKPFVQVHPAATAAYLRTVARNLFISHQRRAGRAVSLDELDGIESDWVGLVTDTTGEQLVAALRECLESLTQRARRALEMRFAERSSRQEIAQALGIGEHGAKNLMQRAKAQLRTCVEGKVK